MKKLITVFLMTIVIMGNSCTDNRSKLAELLYTKYQEEFIIHDNSYSFELGIREFNASPKRFPDLKFYGRYNDSNWIYDYYPETLWNFESVKMIKDLFLNEGFKTYVNCEITTKVKQTEDSKVLNLSNVLADKTDSAFIQNYIYLFNDVKENNKNTILNPIVKLINYYNQFPGKTVFLVPIFWNESFIKDKNIDSINFTLNVDSWDESGNYLNDDNLDNRKKYIKHCLPIKFKTPIKTHITTDTLFSLIQPYDIKGNKEIWIE